MAKLEQMKIRKISKNGDSKSVTIPYDWANIGDYVCVTEKDNNTLIITKNRQG